MSPGENNAFVGLSGPRRSHRKSRDGCKNCKRRRIKCDESKPVCNKCVCSRLACDFASGNPGLISAIMSLAPGKRRRGRPPKCTSAAALTARVPAVLPEVDLAELELMHQYSTYTYLDIDREGVRTMWRVNVPLLGFSEQCVLHNIMAFSAMHLASLRPEQSAHYAALAAHYSTLGLQRTTELLATADETNCQAIYVSAILICLYVLAKGPSPGDYLLFSDNGPSEWVPLLGGLRAIVNTYGLAVLRTGLLAPMASLRSSATQPAAALENKPWIDWERPLEDLRAWLISAATEADVYVEALDGLTRCYEGRYGRGPERSYRGDSANQVVMGWIYRTKQDFILCLEQKRPMALVILAYFAPLLKSMEPMWYMRGWAEHIVAGVHMFVDEHYWAWLRWPQEQIEQHV
ncbi:putative C6 finger domain protein [Lasiodiplodia theobromae]|nr:putative C6 finger domain protein [Lasiodiplodia theobromae]KAF4539473.1 putative C6 finger domain protein [Lasiodiplodia theobromae]